MELRIHGLHINRTWSWILIGAVVALVIAIWLPYTYRGTARAAAPAYTFTYGNSNFASSAVDSDTKPSPFPDTPVPYRR